MDSSDPAIHSMDELPAILNVATLRHFMGISRVSAYNLVNRSDFPTVRVGKRILVPKDSLKRWLEQTSSKC